MIGYWIGPYENSVRIICSVLDYILRLHVILQHIQVQIDMCRGKKIGKRRSLVRRISNWIPVLLPPRIYIKINIINESMTDINWSSSTTISSHSNLQDGLNIISTIFNKTINKGIYLRANVCDIYNNQKISSINKQQKQCDFQHKYYLNQGETSNDTFAISEPRTSTPLGFLDNAIMPVVYNNSAMARISQLEEEIILLRQQVASIVIAQEGHNLKSNVINPVKNPHEMLAPTLSTQSTLLLPPPPPPPPLPSNNRLSIKDQIQQNKLNKCTQEQTLNINGVTKLNSNSNKVKPDMAEVLKGINTVKLRRVERSPGGTPLRKRPLTNTDTDIASIIAVALQKRFTRIHPKENSPEKENNESFDSSTENSPFSSKTKLFGPHLLKPTKKPDLKLQTFSPLMEVNI